MEGIEGFKNVYEILQSAAAGDKTRLHLVSRKIRLVLLCGSDDNLDPFHRGCLTAVLGLVVTDWHEAEKLRLEAAQAYLQLYGKAALCCENHVQRVELYMRHFLLDELTAKQKKSAHAGGLQSIVVANEVKARRILQELGCGYMLRLFKMYPDKAMDRKETREVLELRAVDQRYKSLVEVEVSRSLDFLFEGYFEALVRHHQIESLVEPDGDVVQQNNYIQAKLKQDLAKSKSEERALLTPEEAERKRVKNNKRNRRKRAAEKVKKKEGDTSDSVSETKPDLSSPVVVEAVGDVASDGTVAIMSKAEKSAEQDKDKKGMPHSCAQSCSSSEACTAFFVELQTAMQAVPTSDVEKRIFGV